MPARNKKPLVLTILDGWGWSPAIEGNAIAAAHKPNYDRLLAEFPNTLVHTSGRAVGLLEVSVLPAAREHLEAALTASGWHVVA